MISGYAAVFYDGTPATEYKLAPDFVERIMKGAFDKALKRDDVFGLFNHDPDNILGRSSAGTLQLDVDRKGLRYDIDRADTSLYRDVETWQERGEITGSSFGFIVIAERFVQEAEDLLVREIEEVQLRDVGPVTFPAYSGTEEGRDVRVIDTRFRPVTPTDGIEEVRSRYISQRRDRDRVRVRARTVYISNCLKGEQC